MRMLLSSKCIFCKTFGRLCFFVGSVLLVRGCKEFVVYF